MRFFLWTLTGVLALVVLVCVAVYVPAVQKFAIGKASEIVARQTGIRMTVEQFRVRFPLGISVEGATVIMPAGDTLAQIGSLRLHAALLPLAKGRVRIMDVALENTRASWRDTVSGMILNARIDALSAGSAALDPAEKAVRLTRASIEGGDVALSLGGPSRDSVPPAGDTTGFDWTIDVSRFELRRFAFVMDMPSSPAADSISTPAAPFDYRHIRATEAAVVVRDFRYGANDIAARFEDLALAEHSGLRIVDGNGRFAMNPEGLSLTDFSLETVASQLKGSVTAGAGITDADSRTPVSVQLEALIAPSEIALFAPLPTEFEHITAGKNLTIDGSVDGTLDDLRIERLRAELPPEFTLSAHGTLRGATTPEHLSGSVTLDGALHNLDFARELIADTALRHRVAIPHDMTLRAVADFTLEAYDIKEFALVAGAGRLEGSGSFTPDIKSYAADMRFVDFPVEGFLPRDSLGVATGTLTARGRGFDLPTMEATAALDIDRFDYRTYDLGRVTADIAASGGEITGTVKSRSDLLFTDVALAARISRDTLATISRPAPMSYDITARIDSTVVRLTDTLRMTDPIDIRASASLAGTVATVRSGDLDIDISSPLPPDSLFRGAAHAGSEVQRQLAARHFSADSLQSAFPGMTLTAKVGRGNFLHDIVRLRGFDFRTFSANVSTAEGDPFHIDATALGVTTSGFTVDTLDLHALRNGNMLDYELRLANRPTGTTDLGLIRVSGSAGGKTLTANVLQQNTGGAVGFDFGVKASLSGNTVRAEIAPDPVLGYDRWTVRQGGDWVEYDTTGDIRADLHLGGMTQMVGFLPGVFSVRQIAITSDSLPGIPGGELRLAADGLDLARMLDLFPTAPDLGGTLSADIAFGFHTDPGRGNVIAAKGALGIGDFAFQGRRVADIDADVDFGSDGTGRMLLDGSVMLEGDTALVAKGTYAAGAIDLDLDMPGVPLSLAEGFMPPDAAHLSGTLGGKLHVSGDPSRPVLTGDVGFVDAKVEVVMIGTAFGISPERIVIADNSVTFNNFGLTDPNGVAFTVNGSVNIANLSDPRADLVMKSRNFRFVNSTHTGGSQIYGTAALDADITARGTFEAMRVRGDVSLSEATNIVYIMRADAQKVRDEKQHIVEFVVFADSLLTEDGDNIPPRPLRRAGLDMLLGVKIENGVRATVSLDEVNENRVEVIGGGDLAFTMNRQGDTRLSGRYTLTGGTVYYKPPVIPQKVFAVSDGSYVEWTGSLANPVIKVSATQTMTVRLDYDDGSSKDVAFDITANIEGSLKGIDMRFDLAAPGDIAIQDQLLSMDAEGRMQQALTLMIYNRYTGPGVSSKGMGFDARGQLNDFISKEINQWARNNLKGVDFSMGIDTRDDGTGHSTTAYSYSVSKTLFSDRVKLSIGGKVSDGASASNAANQLLEDVTLEYRLTQRDNMFLKLYRYNTRESILEGEITETGGGFVIRKKMNRLGDIFRRTRPKREKSGKDR